MRVITTNLNPAGTLYFLLSGHLGSVSLTTDASGAIVSQQKFTAWGVVCVEWRDAADDLFSLLWYTFLNP